MLVEVDHMPERTMLLHRGNRTLVEAPFLVSSTEDSVLFPY